MSGNSKNLRKLCKYHVSVKPTLSNNNLVGNSIRTIEGISIRDEIYMTSNYQDNMS